MVDYDKIKREKKKKKIKKKIGRQCKKYEKLEEKKYTMIRKQKLGKGWKRGLVGKVPRETG